MRYLQLIRIMQLTTEHTEEYIVKKRKKLLFTVFLCALFYARLNLIIFKKNIKRTQRTSWKLKVF